MNAFDYFFENTFDLEKLFLVGNEEISFRELYKTSLIISGWIEKKTGKNNNILLISSNNLFFITSYLAIIKSGNICIPLDPSIEKSGLQYICNLTKPALAFISKEIDATEALNSIPKIYPDKKDFESLPKYLITRAEFPEEQCAEIIFTSGSTGKPKGVMISHKNLISNTYSIIQYLKLGKSDRMLVVLPFFYCYGLSLLHTHLRVGGSIVLNNSFIFLGRIIKDLQEYRCTGFAGVPSHFQILLRKSDSFRDTKFPDLKYVTQAGGKLARIFVDEFRYYFPEVKFFIMYGQTEATARLSYLPPEFYEAKKESVGRGIPGVELRVVNENRENVIPGETGELIARGDNIMLGYLPDDDMPEQVIYNGWLYTGDLGTVDEDGFIYLTARKKEIIKLHGKRLSPKEIEGVILEIPDIIDCSLEVIEDNNVEILKASVTVKNLSAQLSEDFIKKYCALHLSVHKIPQIIEFREDISITATGKKIRKI